MSFKVHQIFVQRSGNQLTLSQPELTIEAGEVVQWIFAGVKSDESPTLLVTGSDAGMLGPFTYLRRSHEMVVAKGCCGSGGTFTYQAALVKPDPENDPHFQLMTGPGLVTVTAADPLQPVGQVIKVTLHHHDLLEISPANVCVLPGDPQIWEFEMPRSFGLSWVPSIYFKDREKRGRFFGPFANLAAIDGPLPLGQDALVVRRYVVGTSVVGDGGSFNYVATIRTADGTEYCSSEDPVIETDGDPVCVGNC